MILTVTTIVELVLLFTSLTNALLPMESPKMPCSFIDTVNISSGAQQTDGTILHDDVLYTKGSFAEYNYIFVRGERVPTERHLRGCLCQQQNRPCLFMCCPGGQLFSTEGKCYGNDTDLSVHTQLYNKDGNWAKSGAINEAFSLIYYKPCTKMFALEEDEKFLLYEDGDLLEAFGNITYSRDHFCLVQFKSRDDEFLYTASLCAEIESNIKFIVLPIGMILSIPFLVITFIVYAIFSELRNLHGKCFMCYLFALTIGYSTLACIQLEYPSYGLLCTIFGYIVYVSFMAAFLWLSVISFDLWWNFRSMCGVNREADRRKFQMYSLYAWGITTLLAIMCYCFDKLNIPLSPGFGEGSCFLRKDRLTEFLYLYMPIIFIISLNSIFFTLTFLKIRRVQQEMANITARSESKRHQSNLDSEKDKFGLFFRLFIIMGITWSLEALSWAIDLGSQSKEQFYITDICNTIQGVVIFILFVLKGKVKVLIVKKWRTWRGLPQVRYSNVTSSSRTQSTSMGGTSIKMDSVNPNPGQTLLH